MDDYQAFEISDVCKTTKQGRSTIYKEIHAGRLIARKLGRRTIVLGCDLKNYCAALPVLKTKSERS